MAGRLAEGEEQRKCNSAAYEEHSRDQPEQEAAFFLFGHDSSVHVLPHHLWRSSAFLVEPIPESALQLVV